MGKFIIDTDTGSCTPYVEDGAAAPFHLQERKNGSDAGGASRRY